MGKILDRQSRRKDLQVPVIRALFQFRDPGLELVLLRNCAGACKRAHVLRSKSAVVARKSCNKFDRYIHDDLEGIVCRALREIKDLQVIMSISEAGLGLPYHIQVRIDARALFA